MDDSNPVLPFEFEDCDAFLVSLDENSASLFNQKNQGFQQKPSSSLGPQPTLSDYVSMSAALTDSTTQPDWSRLQPDYSNTSTQPMNLFNQSATLDPFTLQQQQHHHQQQQQQRPSIQQVNPHFSTHSTPLSSPMSAHSTSETDPQTMMVNGMAYQSNISSPDNNMILPAYTGSGSFDAAAFNPAAVAYPISPHYHSTQPGSSLSSPDGTELTNATTFDYSAFSNNSNMHRNSLKMVPTILPHQSLPVQLPGAQPHSISGSMVASSSTSPSNIKQESPKNMYENYEDNAVSPHTNINSIDSADGYSPSAYDHDDYEYKGSSPSGKSASQRSGSIKKDRQYSATRIDAKGNKITKPKKEKTSHNMIEKRYRTNINDKILALRDCVPSLRCVVNGTPRTSEELEGLTPASKLNKATVLTKATEYILHLQKRNNMLLKELSDLRTRRTEPNGVMQNDMAPTGLPPNGMPAYPTLQSQNLQQLDNSFASKVMMCSMAGLMGAGLMNEGADTQGLSFVPFLSYLSNIRFGSWDSSSILYAFKLSLILGTVFYVLSPYFFSPVSSKQQKQSSQPTAGVMADSSSSSFELSTVRKHTWNINSSTLNIPSNTLSSQISSLAQILIQIFIFKVFGPEGYDTFAQNFGQQQLSAKRDSLSRAIDAQLCGCDVNASFSSIFATFAQSFILPASPMRYFTQAMQVNVMCHDTLLQSIVGSKASNYFLNKARQTAISAKDEDESSFDEFHLPKHVVALLNSEDVFRPDITQRLCNVIFNRPISEGCITGDDDEGYTSVISDKSIRSADDVLAALYTNSLLHDVLLGVLEHDEIDFRTLEICTKVSPPRSIVARRIAIAEALLLGPKDASYAQKAMDMLKEELNQQAWVNQDSTEMHLPSTFQVPLASRSRSNSYETVDTLTADSEDDFSSSDDTSVVSTNDSESLSETDEAASAEFENSADFLSTSVKSNYIPFVVSQDSRLGIRFSLIASYLARNMTGPAFQLIQKVEINRQESIGLLGFVAMWRVLREMYEHNYTANRYKLEDLSAIARIWLGGNIGAEKGLSLERLRYLVGESVNMSKFFGGFECDMDEGYGTQ